MTPKKKVPDVKNELKKKYQPPKEIKPEHKELIVKIGVKLEELREKKGVSILQLSKKIGMSRNKYHQMVSKDKQVYFNFLSLLEILDYYNVSIEEFFSEL